MAPALRSVIAQTFTEWELILVDDGSTDDSMEIAGKLCDPRVRVISDGTHKGLPARLNYIADHARAPLLARMDSDDLMHPKRLETQVRYMDDHPEVDVLGSGIYSIDGTYRLRGGRGSSRADVRPFMLALQGLFCHPTVIGRTSWFRRNRYDEGNQRAEDYELWLRTFSHSNFHTIPDKLLFYREDLDGTMDRLMSSYKSMVRVLSAASRGFPARTRIAVRWLLFTKIRYYQVCWFLGCRDYLLDRRVARLTMEETCEAGSVLRDILTHPTKGLDPDGGG